MNLWSNRLNLKILISDMRTYSKFDWACPIEASEPVNYYPRLEQERYSVTSSVTFCICEMKHQEKCCVFSGNRYYHILSGYFFGRQKRLNLDFRKFVESSRQRMNKVEVT